jgi:hypothetical protein
MRAPSNNAATYPESVQGGTTDLLTQAVERAASMLADGARPTKEGIRLLWAAAKIARDLAAADVVQNEFMALALRAALIDDKGRWLGSDVAEHRRAFGAQDVVHVIRWALSGWNPFEQGPLT